MRKAEGPDRRGLPGHRLFAPGVVTLIVVAGACGLVATAATLRVGLNRAETKAAVSRTIVFTGSSSIAYWDSLASDMKPLKVVNSAFGGAQYADLLDQEDDLVIAYHPSAIVVYAGDNDLAAGSRKTPQSVAGEARRFVEVIHSKLPEARVYVLSIKPSYARWNSWRKMKDANQRIEQFLRSDDHAAYIDVASPMFDREGNLHRDLFISDGLHPTAKCYAMWAALIKPILLSRFGPAKDSSREPAIPRFGGEEVSERGLQRGPVSAQALTGLP